MFAKLSSCWAQKVNDCYIQNFFKCLVPRKWSPYQEVLNIKKSGHLDHIFQRYRLFFRHKFDQLGFLVNQGFRVQSLSQTKNCCLVLDQPKLEFLKMSVWLNTKTKFWRACNTPKKQWPTETSILFLWQCCTAHIVFANGKIPID